MRDISDFNSALKKKKNPYWIEFLSSYLTKSFRLLAS